MSNSVSNASFIESEKGQETVLNNILKELKKMNMHLSLLTDVHINNKDIGD